MKQYLSTVSIVALSMMGVFAPTVKADEWNKKTNILGGHPKPANEGQLKTGQ